MLGVLILPFLVLVALRLATFCFSRLGPGQVLSPEDARLQARLRTAGIVVLAAGFAVSGWTYLTADRAEEDTADVIGYDIGDGAATPIHARDSKAFQLQGQTISGVAGQGMLELRWWLAERWHGRHRAETLAVASVFASLFCFFLARFLVFPDIQPGDGGPKAAASAP